MNIRTVFMCVILIDDISSDWIWGPRQDFRTSIKLTSATTRKNSILKNDIMHFPTDRNEVEQSTTHKLKPTIKTNKKRISVRKCEEYKDLAYDKTSVGRYNYLQKTLKCNMGLPLIIQGVEAQLGEFPHMAALGWKKRSFRCGGSLISERFVLTAAHCSNRGTPHFVRLGSPSNSRANHRSSAQEVLVKRFISHPDYKFYGKVDDIALIELQRDVAFTKFIRPACLHQFSLYEGDVIATGWGRTKNRGAVSDDLMKVKLKIKSVDKCSFSDDAKDGNKQMCVGGDDRRDTCEGDSGSPIQMSHRDISCVFDIVGVTSFGPLLCGSKSPAVYTRVSSYIDWIEKTVWG